MYIIILLSARIDLDVITSRHTNAYICDWRHNIGSTAIAIMISFLTSADNQQEVKDMADILLESFSFLYEDLNTSDAKKAFCSTFILQLLSTTHLQAINGAVEFVPGLSPLETFSGVIGLCDAAVKISSLDYNCSPWLTVFI